MYVSLGIQNSKTIRYAEQFCVETRCMTQDHAAGRFLCEKNMSFTKLDSNIVHSSIWSESIETRVLWITMLALANKDGYVACSLPGLARAANISVEATENALVVLTSPDQYSRTSDNEGRRVEKTEGGWIIINYLKYREKSHSDYLSEKQRKYRERMKCIDTEGNGIDTSCNGIDTVSIPSASASASSSGIKEGMQGEIGEQRRRDILGHSGTCPRQEPQSRFIVPALEEIKAYVAEKEYTIDPVKFYSHYVSNGWKVGRNPMKNWKAAIVTWQRGEGNG